MNEFIDFDNLVGQKASSSLISDDWKEKNKQYAIDNFDMKKQIEKWKKVLG